MHLGVWSAFKTHAQAVPRKSRSGCVGSASMQDNGDLSSLRLVENRYATFHGACHEAEFKCTSGHAKRTAIVRPPAQLPSRRKTAAKLCMR